MCFYYIGEGNGSGNRHELLLCQHRLAGSGDASVCGSLYGGIPEEKLGAEFTILREIPPEDIRKAGGEVLAEGIRQLRAGEVVRKPGFDGEYGKIELF